MSLFVVNRYQSEEWKEETIESRDHLSELLARIEERKRKKEVCISVEESKIKNVPETNVSGDEISEKKEKKHKDKKTFKSDLSRHTVRMDNKVNVEEYNFESEKGVSETRALDDDISEKMAKKRKKKRKHDSSISELIIYNNDVFEENNLRSKNVYKTDILDDEISEKYDKKHKKKTLNSSIKQIFVNDKNLIEENNLESKAYVFEKTESDGEILEKKNKRRKKKGKHNSSISKMINNNIVFEENNLKSKDKLCNTPQNSFTVLGHKKHLKNQHAKRVLPYWLTHPKIISSELQSGSNFDEMKTILDNKIIEKLKEDGFKNLFPVQVDLLSWILKCDSDYKSGKWVRDTCVCMPTGSGKTLAYVLPIIQLLQNSFVRMIRCLIVLPVQELASQVCEVVIKYASCVSLKVALLSGASSFKEEQEIIVKKDEKGDYVSLVDIVIATPGRLIDHIRKTTGFSLSNLRFLVIDEADRATEWLQYIPFPHSKPPPLTIEAIRLSSNKPTQKILLSATLSQDPEKLKRLGLFRPILFTSVVIDFEIEKDLNLDEHCNDVKSRYGNPSELTEKIVQCAPQYKPLALYQLLMKDEVIGKTLVFTNSSEAAHRLAILLQSLLKSKDVSVGELSAQLGSKQREETLEKFIQGTFRILVSSDALARGLDIPEIKLVVSYDLPKHVKGYIHRAGRTSRGGIPGTAASILLPNQIDFFNKMMRQVGRCIPICYEENLDDLAVSVDYEKHLENLKNTLNEQQKNLRRSKSYKRTTRT